MELRVLRYFLAVAREESISGAAEALHVTQPTLSRQMMELEEELGKTLFLRGKRKISLTEEGMFLRKRAQEIVGGKDGIRVQRGGRNHQRGCPYRRRRDRRHAADCPRGAQAPVGVPPHCVPPVQRQCG